MMSPRNLAVIGQFLLGVVLVVGCITIYISRGAIPVELSIALTSVVSFFFGMHSSNNPAEV